MKIVQNTFPSILPLELSEMKLNLRVDSTDEDILIALKTRAAQSIIEKYTNRVLISSTFTAYLDQLPYCPNEWPVVNIMKYPVTSIDSVKYYNSAGTLTTLVEGTDYFIDIKDCPARIRFITYPTIQLNRLNGIEIAFTAGYSDINDIDQGIIEALKFITGQLYEQRQNETSNMMSPSSLDYQDILSYYVKGTYL